MIWATYEYKEGSFASRAVRSRPRKIAFNWTSGERFPCASTVGGDLGERLLAQRFPVFADTEGVTGSNPVAPTIKGLTSANAAKPVRLCVRRGEREHLTV
jgi:hypothetical protein